MAPKVVVQKYFNELRKKIRNETANRIEKIKQRERKELAKLDEFEKTMNENLVKRAEQEPELKRLIDDLNSKHQYEFIGSEGSLEKVREEIDELDVKIEAIMKEREELVLKINNSNEDNAIVTDTTSQQDFLYLFELVHRHNKRENISNKKIVEIGLPNQTTETNKEKEILISGSRDKTLKIWNAIRSRSNSNEIELEFFRTLDEINEPVWSLVQLDNHQIAVGLEKGSIQIRNIETNDELIRTFKGHTDSIESLLFIENNKHGRRLLASGSCDKTIKLWDLDKEDGDGDEQALIRTLNGHIDWIQSLVSFYDKNNDRFLLASGSNDTTIKLWNIDDEGNTGNAIQTLTGHLDSVRSLFVAVSQQNHNENNNDSNDSYLISGSFDGTLKLWNLTSFIQMRSINVGFHINVIKQLSEEELVIGGALGNLIILNLNTGEKIHRLSWHKNLITGIGILSNRRIATCSFDNSIKLWNANNGQLIKSIAKAHDSYIVALLISYE